MEDFILFINDHNKPAQSFNGKVYILQNGERYFKKDKRCMHWVVWESLNGKRPKGFHIHHVDNNPWNNRPENLELLEASLHRKHHSPNNWLKTEKGKEHNKKIQEFAKHWHKSAEGKAWHKEHAKKFNFGAIDHGITNCKQCLIEIKKRSSAHSFCSTKCKQRFYALNY